MTQPAWLTQRALTALALLAGFYVLALALAGTLSVTAFLRSSAAGSLLPLDAFGAVVAVGILWVIAPRWDRYSPPGPRLTDRSHPDLFRVIQDVAAKAHQPMPDHVFLVNAVTVSLTCRGGWMGVGGQRVLALGLPLLQGLSVSELRALLAHEFGHETVGGVRLGPIVYRLRVRLGRGRWHGRMFFDLTQPVARHQEFCADALAARLVRPTAMASALRRVEGLAPAFTAYWQHEVRPALDAGCLPPLAEGFNQFLGSDQVSALLDRSVSGAELRAEARHLDPHPSLRHRLGALSGITGSAVPRGDDPPADILLRDLEGHARRLLEFEMGAAFFAGLKRVNWLQAAAIVQPKQWRESALAHADFLAQYSTDGLPRSRAAFEDAGVSLLAIEQPENPDLSDVVSDMRVARACQVFGAAVSLVLLESGLSPEASPGHPVTFRRGEAWIQPFAAMARLADGRLTPAMWETQCRAMGIAGRSLRPRPRT